MSKTMVFKGYHGDVWYGDGAFTVGGEYKIVSDINQYANLPPDALFIDDDGVAMYEDIQYFE